jgi:capsule polysaccharide export protein KpsE/RkpR
MTPAKPNRPSLSPEVKLALAQKDVAKFQALAASPNLSPKAVAWALDMVRSARAEIELRQKGLAYQEKIASVDLGKLMGLDKLPKGPEPPSG